MLTTPNPHKQYVFLNFTANLWLAHGAALSSVLPLDMVLTWLVYRPTVRRAHTGSDMCWVSAQRPKIRLLIHQTADSAVWTAHTFVVHTRNRWLLFTTRLVWWLLAAELAFLRRRLEPRVPQNPQTYKYWACSSRTGNIKKTVSKSVERSETKTGIRPKRMNFLYLYVKLKARGPNPALLIILSGPPELTLEHGCLKMKLKW